MVIRASSAIFQVEIRKALEHFVERLLLVFVSLADAEHLVRAEFTNFVPLKDVVLAHPAQLPSGILAHAANLRRKTRFMLSSDEAERDVCIT